MLLRHASGYFAATVLQAASGLLLLAVLTRLLPVDEYGRYALALAVLQIGGGPLFHWCRALVTRFLVSAELAGDRACLLATVQLGLLGSGLLAAAAIAVIDATNLLDPRFDAVLWAILPTLLTQAAFQVRTEIHRAALRLRRCATMIAAQAALAVVLSVVLAVPLGLQAAGAVYGGALSCLLCLLADRSEPWAWARPLPWRTLRPMLGYSLPLAVMMALEMVLQSGDRFVIAGLLGTDAVAAYAAPQTLAMRSIANLCGATAAASLPIVIATFERHGQPRTRAALRQASELMLAAAIPCTTAFIVLAGPITDIMIGPALRPVARTLLPLIAVATLLNGFTSHYVAHGFLLARRTALAVAAIVPAAALGVGLDLLLVPRIGVVGAGYALIAAQCVYLLLSLLLVRRFFPLPVPVGPSLVLLLSCLAGAALVAALPLPAGLPGLLIGGAILGLASLTGIAASGIAGIRDALTRRAFG